MSNVFQAMRELGFTRVEGSFSGGNDEGGYDRLRAYKADGKRKDLETYGKHTDPNEQTIVDYFETVLDERYGSFAGDYSVNGTVVVDEELKKVSINGEQSVWEGFTDELDAPEDDEDEEIEIGTENG